MADFKSFIFDAVQFQITSWRLKTSPKHMDKRTHKCYDIAIRQPDNPTVVFRKLAVSTEIRLLRSATGELERQSACLGFGSN